MLDKRTLLIRSLWISGALACFKLAVFFITNSVAVLALAVDSFMDFMVSLLNFIFVRHASKPADSNHPYGHGKIESVGGLLQSLCIAGAAVAVAITAARRFSSPEPIEQPIIAVLVTVISLAVSLWHARNLHSTGSESQIMATEYIHYASDALVYIGVLISFLLFKVTGALFWDPLISVAIVIYLLITVFAVFRSALAELLDEQLPAQALKEIDQIIIHFSPKVVGYHDLRTRKVGPTKFIEFHVVLRDVDRFEDAHDLVEALTEKLKTVYPGAIVTVHGDPEGGI